MKYFYQIERIDEYGDGYVVEEGKRKVYFKEAKDMIESDYFYHLTWRERNHVDSYIIEERKVKDKDYKKLLEDDDLDSIFLEDRFISRQWKFIEGAGRIVRV